MNKQNRNKPVHIENQLMITRWEGLEEVKWVKKVKEVRKYILLVIRIKMGM